MNRRVAGSAALLALTLVARAGLGAETVARGAYCPFPKEGEIPQCLEPAKREYREFFTAVDTGALTDADASRLERDVASGASSQTPYLAISSLSYGYFRLAQRAAARPDEDPAVVARLQRWNALLAEAYATSERDADYRAAVQKAAQDLHDRAPRVVLECVDPDGRATKCDSTAAVLRGFNRTGEQVGIRGALGRLIGRIFGGDDS